MPRSRYIYLVTQKGLLTPVLACFTVKYEAQNWAENSSHGIETLELTRMVDGGDNKFVSSRVLCPWEDKK